MSPKVDNGPALPLFKLEIVELLNAVFQKAPIPRASGSPTINLTPASVGDPYTCAVNRDFRLFFQEHDAMRHISDPLGKFPQDRVVLRKFPAGSQAWCKLQVHSTEWSDVAENDNLEPPGAA